MRYIDKCRNRKRLEQKKNTDELIENEQEQKRNILRDVLFKVERRTDKKKGGY